METKYYEYGFFRDRFLVIDIVLIHSKTFYLPLFWIFLFCNSSNAVANDFNQS